MKFYPAKDLHDKLQTIKQGLFEKTKTYLSSLPRSQLLNEKGNVNYSCVYLELYYNNKRIKDVYSSDIKGFVLKDEKPKVYRVLRKNGGRIALVVIGILEIKEIVYGNTKDFLGIGNDTFTFHTYKELLTFVDASLREESEPIGKVNILLSDRKTDISLRWMLEDSLIKDGDPLTFHLHNLTNLNDYQKLSEEHKKRIDELICPIVLDSKSCTNVTVCNNFKSVSIAIDKEDLVNKNLRTSDWDDYIMSVLTPENQSNSTN